MATESGSDIAYYLRNFTYRENADLMSFSDYQPTTQVEQMEMKSGSIPRYTNEFWTSKQRMASAIHEISYRACFKPQLPRFFIKLLTQERDVVYDPFSGRGTTVVEAGLLGRNVISNDINPLSRILTIPRFHVPMEEPVRQRLREIEFDPDARADIDLTMFYHPSTEAEIVSLRNYLAKRDASRTEDDIDRWIRMVATNRLTGHSSGFFSIYTLPPNQAVSAESQRKINEKLGQNPEYRNTREMILRKAKSLLRGVTEIQKKNLRNAGKAAIFLTKDARYTSEIEPCSVQLTVTSPPFLDIVQYSKDNWLRCWFNSINDRDVAQRITMSKTIEEWSDVMGAVFSELNRVTRPNGWVAFEVGEIRRGTLKLDEYVVPLGQSAGFDCEGIIINLQEFTKTSNIWGVNNNDSGTNTNRIVLFRKQGV
jgi:hypothetical protein